VVLLAGVFLGLAAGFVRAWLRGRTYSLPDIQRMELVLLAFLPQALIFLIPQTGRYVSERWAAWILPLSLGVLLFFVWSNRRLPGFWLLGVGLLLNLAVIVANGGLMPISPETLAIVRGVPVSAVKEGTFVTKDVVLAVADTRLEWLSDRFPITNPSPIHFAFSLGDVFIAMGAFWALWSGYDDETALESAVVDRPINS